MVSLDYIHHASSLRSILTSRVMRFVLMLVLLAVLEPRSFFNLSVLLNSMLRAFALAPIHITCSQQIALYSTTTAASVELGL